MSVWTLFWVALVSFVALLSMRNACRIYRRPRETQTAVGMMDARQSRRAAAAVLIGMPLIWLVVVLSMFGLLGPSPFQGE